METGMSADTPRRHDAPDDLARAYAQAQALADGDRGPAAAVRANVLAAARTVADEAARTAAVPQPLAPVAPPLAEVGRGRAGAVNRSSWRLRSGAALCAVLLVGLVGWRFDAARRLHAGEQQVALAELRPAAPAPVAVPPAPAPAPAEPVPEIAAAPPAPPPMRTPTPPTPHRLAKAATGTVVVAAAEPDRPHVDATGDRPAFSGAPAAETARRSPASSIGSPLSARAQASPLQAAADRGDVETLRRLLDGAAPPVDAPDAAGRTALLHAVLAQRPAAVRLLLAAGADPARADRAGLTPRAAAQAGANAEIAALLAAPR
jgi:hypothetical protein